MAVSKNQTVSTMKCAKRYPFLRILQNRLTIYFDNQSGLNDLPSLRQFRLWAWQAIKRQYYRANISILLLDEEQARAYNRDYRNKDYATNVLSFALNEGEMMGQDDGVLTGDLIICPQVLIKEAQEQGKSVESHFAHLVIHGVLHLMGYDHTEEQQAQEMEALETRLLQQLNYPNPY